MSESGIADWRVRRVGAAGSNGEHSNSLIQFNRSYTTCSSSVSLHGDDSVCLYTPFFGNDITMHRAANAGYNITISRVNQ